MSEKTADSNGAAPLTGQAPGARINVTDIGGVSGVDGRDMKGTEENHNRLVTQDLETVGGEQLNDDPPQVDVGGPLKQELGEPTSTWSNGRGDSAGQHDPVTNKGLDMYHSAFDGIQHTALQLTPDPRAPVTPHGKSDVDVGADLLQEVGGPTSTWGSDSFHITDPVTNEHFPTDGVSDSGKAVHHPSEKAPLEELQSGQSNPMGDPAHHGESEKASLEELGGGSTKQTHDIRAHLLNSMRVAEIETALGITSPREKFDRAAALEKETPGELKARIDSYTRVSKAGLRRPVASQRQAAATPMPSLANLTEEAVSSTFDDEASALFM